MREGLVYGVERGGAEGIVGCGARVAPTGTLPEKVVVAPVLSAVNSQTSVVEPL